MMSDDKKQLKWLEKHRNYYQEPSDKAFYVSYCYDGREARKAEGAALKAEGISNWGDFSPEIEDILDEIVTEAIDLSNITHKNSGPYAPTLREIHPQAGELLVEVVDEELEEIQQKLEADYQAYLKKVDRQYLWMRVGVLSVVGIMLLIAGLLIF